MNATSIDTIAAQATPPGRGGVGIIRISGPLVFSIAKTILKKIPKARYAEFAKFYDADDSIIDEGLALYFPGPNSFTGEDVLELQGHGGPVILDCLLKRIVALGARLAKPGEFSERAFLNDKMDLAQAEAVADLINSSSEQAARSAVRSLQGEFSQKVHALVEALIHLRMYVEAAIDFPEEEINFLADDKVKTNLENILQDVITVLNTAKQGALLQEGMTVVIAGKPNAGKSSLLNQLSGRESAIVTDVAGTTRDVLREYIHIDGMPLHIIDTAGLRESPDKIEQEGIRRAWDEINKADKILLVVDSNETDNLNPESIFPEFISHLKTKENLAVIKNKIDLTKTTPAITEENDLPIVALSAKTGTGIELLKQYLKDYMGYNENTEGGFIARRRHLDALNKARDHITHGQTQLQVHQAGELLAEDLRQAQQALSEITGEFTSDDLLGEIFSSFCIGK